MSNLFSAMLQYQLALIEAYEANLSQIVMDEAQLNDALKSWLLSLMPLLNAHRRLSEQMLAAHRDAVAQYSGALRKMLDPHGPAAP